MAKEKSAPAAKAEKEKKETPKKELWHGMRGSKYDPVTREKAVALVKSGKTPVQASKELGGKPNPLAIKRYCAAMGVAIPERAPKVKAEKTEKPAKK